MAIEGKRGQHAVEAARAAALAFHAASGLAHGCVQAQRLLRTAEGLVRSATAVLLTASSSPMPASTVVEPWADAPRRSRRPRGKRGGLKKQARVMENVVQVVAVDEDMEDAVMGVVVPEIPGPDAAVCFSNGEVPAETSDQRQHLEQDGHMQLPMTQAEVVHVPKVQKQTRVQHQVAKQGGAAGIERVGTSKEKSKERHMEKYEGWSCDSASDWTEDT